MKGLWAIGMTEAVPLTQHQLNTQQERLFDMPPFGCYRFGAHVINDDLVQAFRRSPLLGVFVRRMDREAQLESAVKHWNFVHGQCSPKLEKQRIGYLIDENLEWSQQPGVMTATFEDLLHDPEEWRDVLVFLGGHPTEDDLNKILRLLPPQEGHPYYENTLPSKVIT